MLVLIFAVSCAIGKQQDGDGEACYFEWCSAHSVTSASPPVSFLVLASALPTFNSPASAPLLGSYSQSFCT